MKQRRYISLSATEYAVVHTGYTEGKKHHFRERCQAILLSHEKYTIGELALMFKKQNDTIRTWFNQWEAHGIKGLEIQEGRGLKPKLSVTDPELVALVKKKSKNSR